MNELQLQHEAHKARMARFGVRPATIPIFRQAEISTIEAVPFHPLSMQHYWENMWFGDLIFGGPRTEYFSIKQVQDAVAKHFGISIQQMRSDCRTYHITRARQIGYYLARECTKFSIEQIALQFNRDHSSLCHGVKKIKAMVDRGDPIKVDIAKINRTLGR